MPRNPILQWRHNERDCASNHQPYDCLFMRLFGRRSQITSKLRVTGLCAGNSPVTGEFPAQRTSDAENVSIWWRHHGGVRFWSCTLRSTAAIWRCRKQIYQWQCSFHLKVTLPLASQKASVMVKSSVHNHTAWRHNAMETLSALLVYFARINHWSLVDSPNEGLLIQALMVTVLLAWTSRRKNSRVSADCMRHGAYVIWHYREMVLIPKIQPKMTSDFSALIRAIDAWYMGNEHFRGVENQYYTAVVKIRGPCNKPVWHGRIKRSLH